MGLSRDSRQTRCACLIKESDVYKCKHSILFTQCLLAALLLSGARWLGAFLSPSVKCNSIEAESHFIFDSLILIKSDSASYHEREGVSRITE